MSQPARVPELIIAIWCSVCDSDVHNDGDGFVCTTCDVYWAKNAWDGDKAERRLSTDELLVAND